LLRFEIFGDPDMTLLQILPILVYALAIVTILVATSMTGAPRPGLWRYPALLGAVFALFSVATVAQDGLVTFWDNHTANLTGNQVWFDLLAATSIGFVCLLPRARAVGMRPWPWAIATIATACVALLPMLARVLWLEEQQRKPGSGAVF
jgi:hypothetical protein